MFVVGETNEFALKQYYIDAYEQVRKNSDCLLTVMPLRDHQSSRNTDWMQFMRPPHYGGILHEWHRYQIWGYEGSNTKKKLCQFEVKNSVIHKRLTEQAGMLIV